MMHVAVPETNISCIEGHSTRPRLVHSHRVVSKFSYRFELQKRQYLFEIKIL
jgi:hypothetical protein